MIASVYKITVIYLLFLTSIVVSTTFMANDDNDIKMNTNLSDEDVNERGYIERYVLLFMFEFAVIYNI